MEWDSPLQGFGACSDHTFGVLLMDLNWLKSLTMFVVSGPFGEGLW